jgi:hypothetical protein
MVVPVPFEAGDLTWLLQYLPAPPIVLAVLVGLLHVLLFAVLFGRPGRSTLYYLPFGLAGSVGGHALATFWRMPLPRVGDCQVVAASLLAWLLIVLASLRRP